jgi:hypothetical protein
MDSNQPYSPGRSLRTFRLGQLASAGSMLFTDEQLTHFFVDGWTGLGSSGALVSYANGKLEMHYHDRLSGSEIHVELVLDPIQDAWTGHFHRKSYDGQVILHRTSDRPDPAQGGCFLEGASLPPS